MVNSSAPIRRLLVAAALAGVTLATPILLAASGAGSAVAACSSGEEMDVYTTTCTPFLVPNSSAQGFTSTAANPDIPEIDGVPCTGGDSGACIGLAENEADAGPQPVPRSTISSSP